MANQIMNTLWGIEVFNPAPVCSIKDCKNPCQHTGNYTKTGSIIYRKICQYHHYMKHEMSGWNYKKYRKSYCENVDGRLGYYCTATIVDPALQLDVDHVDGNHENNDESNLHTLCRNCHQYKTVTFKENGKKKYRQLVEIDAEKKEVLIEYVKLKNSRK